MKYWNALTDEAKDALMVVAFLVEAFFLFGVLA